jgi:quercetin dioxygenase-like cupin family protein
MDRTAQAARAIVAPAGTGARLQIKGDDFTVKMEGTEPGASFTLFECLAQPGSPSPPPHVHNKWAESFFVIDGEMAFQAGGEALEAAPGSFVHVPPGVPHTYGNVGARPARFLCIVSPGGFASFFRDLAAIMPAGAPPSFAAMMELARKYDSPIPDLADFGKLTDDRRGANA